MQGADAEAAAWVGPLISGLILIVAGAAMRYRRGNHPDQGYISQARMLEWLGLPFIAIGVLLLLAAAVTAIGAAIG